MTSWDHMVQLCIQSIGVHFQQLLYTSHQYYGALILQSHKSSKRIRSETTKLLVSFNFLMFPVLANEAVATLCLV